MFDDHWKDVKKSLRLNVTVLKLTQVGEMRILRLERTVVKELCKMAP